MGVYEHATNDTSQVLLDDPELAQNLRGDRLAAATRDCTARAINVPTGPWMPPDQVESMRFGIGLLIIDGLVVRRVGVAGRFGAELLGDGDILRPWHQDDGSTTLPRTGKWRALRPSRMAVLDSDFALRLTRYPEVMSTLFGRALRRSRHIAVNMAIVQQPRIDLRLHMLFWELADRWGTVRQDGVHVPLYLTHSTLADLVAARRPTVTKALGELADRSTVMWTGDDWLLPGEPPDELHAVGSVTVPAHAR
ncbi:MAG TPA: helix-turn-helix domain-containing protein [Solirubrobacteraceae bacterium]|jgi:CRP-like cAMP-binding protein